MFNETNYIMFLCSSDQGVVVGKQLCRRLGNEHMYTTFDCIYGNGEMSAYIRKMIIRSV